MPLSGIGSAAAAGDHGADLATALTAATAALTASTASSLQKTSNLSDLASASTARTNLGLGTAATSSSSSFGRVSGGNTWTGQQALGSGTAAGATDLFIDSGGRTLFAKSGSTTDHVVTAYLTGQATLSTSTVPRTVTDAVLANGSATLTSATAAFTGQDNGRTVTGTGIPDGTTIAPTSATTATMSNPATADGTGVTVTITSTPSGGSTPYVNNSALNVISENYQNSAVFVNGSETNRGTVKIAHRGYADASDANAAAVSIDLQTYYTTPGGTRVITGTTGQKARGIFITSTTDLAAAGVAGDAMCVRFTTSTDDFRITGAGKTILGSPVGSTPQATLDTRAPAAGTAFFAKQPVTSGQAAVFAADTAGNAGDVVQFKDSTGSSKLAFKPSGSLVASANLYVSGAGLQIGSTSGTFAGVTGALGLTDVSSGPNSTPTGGLSLFSQAGVLKYRGSSGVTVTLDGTSATDVRPTRRNLLGFSFDPAAAVNATAPTAGQEFLVRVIAEATGTANKVTFGIGNTPATVANAFVGIRDSTGALLASSADQSTALNSATAGKFTVTLSSGASVVQGGTYYVVGVIGSAGTMPTLSRGASNTVINDGLTTGGYQTMTAGSGLTALPANVTMSGAGQSGTAFYASMAT